MEAEPQQGFCINECSTADEVSTRSPAGTNVGFTDLAVFGREPLGPS